MDAQIQNHMSSAWAQGGRLQIGRFVGFCKRQVDFRQVKRGNVIRAPRHVEWWQGGLVKMQNLGLNFCIFEGSQQQSQSCQTFRDLKKFRNIFPRNLGYGFCVARRCPVDMWMPVILPLDIRTHPTVQGLDSCILNVSKKLCASRT